MHSEVNTTPPGHLSRLRYYRRILSLGFPILIGQLGMIAVGFADNSMLGHYHTNALASASFVNNLFNIPILMSMGFTFGLTPLIGALFSRKSNDEIGRTLRAALRLNVAFALLLTLVMLIIYFNLEHLGQPEVLLPSIRSYYLIYLAGLLPIALFQVFAQCAYAVNATRMPMWIILSANALNVLGNWLLISGHLGCPEMGLNGAGLATLGARWICPVAIFIVFMTSRRYRPYRAAFFHPQVTKSTYRTIFKTSIPVSLQMGMETGSFSIAAVMAGWLHNPANLAAFQIIVIVGTLGFCIYYSMGAAVSVLVANAAGENDCRKMRSVAMAGYHVILFLATISSLVFYLWGKPLIGIFTSDPEVQTLTAALIVPLLLYQLGDATQINFSSALRGTSNVMPMLLTAFIAYIVVGLPATYIFCFTFGWQLYGIVLSFSVSLFTAGALFLFFFYKTTKRLYGID